MTTYSMTGRVKTSVRQAGTFAVEFSIVVVLFLLLIFTVMEAARELYNRNTLQEVTRSAARAAATTDFSNAEAMNTVRRNAIFRATPGTLALGDPITDEHVIIDYLALENNSDGSMTQVPIAPGSLPGCPARNRVVCSADAGSPSCIRYVRVRICEKGSNCTPVPYKAMANIVSMPATLPISTSIVRAESLGYTPGMPMCN